MTLQLDERLAHAIDGLHHAHPEFSAVDAVPAPRPRWAWTLVVVLPAIVFAGHALTIALVAAATVLYVAAFAYRFVLLRAGFDSSVLLRVTDEEARALPDAALPIYTVLVPVYREPAVAGDLVRALEALEYPSSLLDVQVLCESDDAETISAVRAARPRHHIRLVIVPAAEPRTKPKALNYALGDARGDLVTIFDAEDQPEPLQLRRAAVAFSRLGPDVACLQARLCHGDPDQNLLTRWFAAEYDTHFGQLLPAMNALGVPLPLGGTSNHIRRRALELVGQWDPYNVTEDADLGVRFHRFGYRVRVLDSVTVEESNSDLINWMKQRSRWYKGYWQTWLVHLRRPGDLVSELGWRGVLTFTLFVGATPTLALVNLVFWAMSLVWLAGHRVFIEHLFPAPLYYAAMISWVAGNVGIVYANTVSVLAAGKPRLVPAALLTPLYWILMALAAVKGLVQLVRDPTFWEKTTHGLNGNGGAASDDA
jgi:cellulose synthase/poly-beta-1,6-N-acetylglucosamine synthase-like glycosyltransferase